MVTPPDVELIRNVTLNETSELVQSRRKLSEFTLSEQFKEDFVGAAQPKLLPGYYTDEQRADLGFKFNISAYYNNTLKLKMNFSDPAYISKETGDPEKLEINFIGNMFFFDEEGQMLEENTTVSKTMP